MLLCPWDSPGKNTGEWLPFPSPGDLPDPGIEPVSLTSPALAGGFFTTNVVIGFSSVQSLSHVRIFATP